MKIIDISIPITPTIPIWPGDPQIDLTQISAIINGDSSNITHFAMSVHTGTHIDAPKHFIDSGMTVEQIPFSKLIGEALVIEIDPQVNVISEHILKEHPSIHLLAEINKVLFHTRNSKLWKQCPGDFYQNYVGIDISGARFLQQYNLELIGIDYLSIAPYDDTDRPHQILLSGGSILLEGLDLSDVPGGIFDLYCLPLRIAGCEGAPARAILINPRE